MMVRLGNMIVGETGVGKTSIYKVSMKYDITKQTSQDITNANAAVKVEKFYRDGQLIIRKNGVEYNALGARL